MLSKLFKKTKKEVTKSNIEKLNNNELKNVIGGTEGTPIGGIIVKGGGATSTTVTYDGHSMLGAAD